MSHLGDRVAALVDGELDHDSRDRMYAHLAHCAACRAELDRHRGVKQMLRASSAPLPPTDTLVALSSLARIGAPPPPAAPGPSAGRLVPHLEPGPPTELRMSPRAAVMTVGALSLAGLVMGTPFAGGTAVGPTGGPQPSGVAPIAQLSVDPSRGASTSSGFSSSHPTTTFTPAGMMSNLTPSLGPLPGGR